MVGTGSKAKTVLIKETIAKIKKVKINPVVNRP